jgi:hypothetical protein
LERHVTITLETHTEALFMNIFNGQRGGWAAALGCLALVMIGLGCGRIGDPDRIRIAKIDGEYITRSDLLKLLRDMGDKERPQINNKGDYLRVLNQYIDARIKLPLGKQLAEEGKIKIPREAAREQFFKQSGDDEEQLRNMWAMEVPASGEITPLMKVYDLTPESISGMKVFIEQETDSMLERLQADEAVAYLAVEDFKKGGLKIDPAELEREYRLRKDSFKKLEWMKFVALRFPAALPDAASQAAHISDRLNAGETFDDIVRGVLAQREMSVLRPEAQAVTVMESEIENNPELVRFKGFWSAASGAQPGEIIGPVYLPDYQQIAQDAQGRSTTIAMPSAYIIFKVLEQRPESTLTLEEATPMLAPPILVARKMAQLREEHGVEIYEDKLPDPMQFRDEFSNPMDEL